MKKICSVFLALLLLLSALYVIPATGVLAETAYDLETSVGNSVTGHTFLNGIYASNSATYNSKGVNITAPNLAMTTVAGYDASVESKNTPAQVFIANNSHDGIFYVKKGVTYNITGQAYMVSKDLAGTQVTLYLTQVESIDATNSLKMSDLQAISSGMATTGAKPLNSTFTATEDGYLLLAAYGSTNTAGHITGWADMMLLYINEITVKAQANLTVKDSNGEVIKDFTGISASTKWSELDVAKEGYILEGLYADAAFTTPVEGESVGVNSVVYAKYTAVVYDLETSVGNSVTGHTFLNGIYASNSATYNSKGVNITAPNLAMTTVAGYDASVESKNTPAQVFIANNSHDGIFYVKKGVTYNITGQAYMVPKDLAGTQVTLYLTQVESINATNSLKMSDLQAISSGMATTGVKPLNSTFTATEDGYLLLAAYGSTNTVGHITGWADMMLLYINEITVKAQANLTVKDSNGEVIKDFTGISASTKWSELDIPVEDGYILEGLYTDAAFTTPVEGEVVGVNSVVYAKMKVKPSYGMATSNNLGLFIGGQDLSGNSGITGAPDGSAVYMVNGVKYTAFRVFGTYVAPASANDANTPDFGKLVTENGIKTIKSRHVMLGYSAEPTIGNNYTMSTATTDFDKCWEYKKNKDGTFTVTYSLLLKKIPEKYATTSFYVNSAIVTEEDADSYVGTVLSEKISAKLIYDKATESGYSVGWFN